MVSRPCDLSTVVTCRLCGRTLLEDTLHRIGCSVKMYFAELARSDVCHNYNNKDGGGDDTTTANNGGGDDDDGGNLLASLLNYSMEQSPS